MTEQTELQDFTTDDVDPQQESLEIEEDNTQDEMELKQLEEELGDQVKEETSEENATKNEPQQPSEQQNVDVKAKLERLRILRQKKKERKRAKKLQEKPVESHLEEILRELESSFDGKEFQVLIRVLQPPLKTLKERYYTIKNDLMTALTRYYPQVDIKLFGSCVTDLIFDSKYFIILNFSLFLVSIFTQIFIQIFTRFLF